MIDLDDEETQGLFFLIPPHLLPEQFRANEQIFNNAKYGFMVPNLNGQGVKVYWQNEDGTITEEKKTEND